MTWQMHLAPMVHLSTVRQSLRIALSLGWHPKKSFKCPSRSLVNHSWRLLKEITQREFKAAPTKYWFSSSLELYKLCFWLIYCISIYAWTCLNKSLHIFPNFPAKYKEMIGGSRLLHCIIYMFSYTVEVLWGQLCCKHIYSQSCFYLIHICSHRYDYLFIPGQDRLLHTACKQCNALLLRDTCFDTFQKLGEVWLLIQCYLRASYKISDVWRCFQILFKDANSLEKTLNLKSYNVFLALHMILLI